MSNLLRADPARLRELAEQFSVRAGDTADLRRRAAHGWARLDQGWRSYAKGDAEAQFDDAQRLLDRTGQLFAQLAHALHTAAALIERADADAAARYTHDSASEQTGGGPTAPPPVLFGPAPFPVGTPGDAPRRPLDPYPPPPGVMGPPGPPGQPAPGGNSGAPPASPPPSAAMPPVPPWMQTVDSAVSDALKAWLPDLRDGEEYARLRLTGDVKLQNLGLPVVLAPGATIRIIRKSDGTYEVRLEGMGDVLAGGGGAGLELGAGVRARTDTRLVFDPSNPGDMSAMALFLIGSGAQAASGVLPAAALTNLLTSRLTGENRLLWIDNLRSSVVGAGLALKGQFPGPVESRLNSDFVIGGGFERMPDGQIANVTVLSSKTDARLRVPNLVATVGGQGRLESDTRVTIADSQPPVTRIEVKLKASAGGVISLNIPGADNKVALINSGSGEVTYTVTVTGDRQAVMDQIAAGTLDVDALRRQGVDISANLVANGSLNNAVEASVEAPTLGKVGLEIERGVVGPDTPITVPGLTF